MSPIKRFATLFAAALSLTAGTSYGDTFDFSYTFDSGAVASGSFEGNSNGILVTNLSNIVLSINGGQVSGPILDFYYTGSGYAGGSVVGFLGTDNNFIFADSDFPTPQPSADFSIVGIAHDDGLYQLNPAVSAGGIVTNDVLNSHWSLTQVPDGGTTLAMLGMAVAGLVGLRRRLR